MEGTNVVNEPNPPLYPHKTNSKLKERFKAYVAHAKANYASLPPEYRSSIELMNMLNLSGAPICLYDKLIEWHFKYKEDPKRVTSNELFKKLRERYNMHHTAPYDVSCTLPRSGVKLKIPCHDAGAMLTDLLTDTRIKDEDYLFHNNDPLAPPPEEWLKLEDINTGRAYRATYDSLIRPNPVADSGRHKILLPIVFYQDATNTGSMQALSIEIVKFTLGIFNCTARNKDYCWRNLGFVPKYETEKKKAREFIQNAGHSEAKCYLSGGESDSEDAPNPGSRKRKQKADVGSPWAPDFDVGPYIDEDVMENVEDEDVYLQYLEEEEGLGDVLEDPDEAVDEGDEPPEPPILAPTIPDGGKDYPNQAMQDFHKILHVILYSYRKLQDCGGVEWDLKYKDEVYKLLLIPFCIFVKGDTVEHDRHCGKYGARTKGVKQLCRYCTCPTEESDDPYASFPAKTQTIIQNFVKKRNVEALHNMSQKFIWNAWYEIRFGQHNDSGIHGACPMEILHWILLGQYKYSVQMFFEQTGKTSILAKEVCSVTAHLGWLFQRQSDKSFPRTMFKDGIRSGYLQGHEQTGVVLVLATTLRTTLGRQTILRERRGKQKEFFRNKKFVTDWIMLLETQLCLEAFLHLRSVDVAIVERLEEKVRQYMQLTKRVGKRQSGQGHNTMNFHAIQHVPNDMLNFGSAANVDTMTDEKHHRPDKKSAKRTQKRPKTFEKDTAKKIEDKRLIDLGMEELKGRVRWDYFEGFHERKDPRLCKKPRKSKRDYPYLGGVTATIRYCDEEDKYIYSIQTDMKDKSKYIYEEELLDKFAMVAFEVEGYQDEGQRKLLVHSEFTTEETIYRAAPHFMGKPWWDWALFRYREADEEKDNPNNPAGTPFVDEGQDPAVMPAQLRGFIDLRWLPEDNDTKYDSKIYAVVEEVRRNNDPEEWIQSNIFQPYVKKATRIHGTRRWSHHFAVRPLDEMVAPACVIPDLNNKHPKAYIRVASPQEWADHFLDWVETDHTRDFDEEQSI